MLTKIELNDMIWQYSRHFGNLLGYCESSAMNGDGTVALIMILNILESAEQNCLNDFECNAKKLIQVLRIKGIISQIECDFLNNDSNGIRSVRNIFVHKNISAYYFTMPEISGELQYPFSENANCLIFYDCISYPLFLLISNLIAYDDTEQNEEEKLPSNNRHDFQEDVELSIIDNEIQKIHFDIGKLTPEELFRQKGIDPTAILKLGFNDARLYRLADNASDVNLLEHIYKYLF